MLRIGPYLELGLDLVTSTQAILAKKGSGKSYTASVMAEEMLGAGQQIVVIDPTGAWYGLRSSADGKSAGFPIAILGGEHGDVPLEVGAGEVIAQAIVSERFSCVLDLELFRKGELQRFVAPFLETLYRLNREAVHVFVDEADVVAPQKPFGEEMRTLGAMQDLVRRGRRKGIGVTMITQRPQVLNKDVLSQADMLTALRMNHPKDLGAVREWVDTKADVGQAKEMIASLPSLPIGEAWFWAPGSNLFQRATVRRRTTFDSGATPKAGQRTATPKVLAQVDLLKLGETIASTVERAKETDPKSLRAEILKLKAELAEQRAAPPPAPTFATELVALRDAVGRAITVLGDGLVITGGPWLRPGEAPPPGTSAASRGAVVASVPASRATAQPMTVVTGKGDPSLGAGARKILTALAQYPSGRTKVQVAILTSYAHTGGGFSNYISALRSQGYLEGDAGLLRITDAGRTALGTYNPLPTGRALLDHWLRQLSKAERSILEVLAAEYPKPVPKDFVALKAGYEANGGGFNNALSRLRTLELIEGKAKMKASDALFETV